MSVCIDRGRYPASWSSASTLFECVHVVDQFVSVHPKCDGRVHMIIDPDLFLYLVGFTLGACRCLPECYRSSLKSD